MPIEILVPRLGWSMETGAFVAWLKREGDLVRPGDPLFTLEGDKAMQDVESLDEGVLRIALDAPQTGQPIRVGQLLGHLLLPGEIAPRAPEDSLGNGAGSALRVSVASVGSEQVATSLASAPSASPRTPVRDGTTPPITPRARRLARERGMDWTRLTGSGRGGRIRESDVLAGL